MTYLTYEFLWNWVYHVLYIIKISKNRHAKPHKTHDQTDPNWIDWISICCSLLDRLNLVISPQGDPPKTWCLNVGEHNPHEVVQYTLW